ncbi:MAG: class I SAM-dependent methyltransferase [Planctomycetia bacterium]|nr:class I SAM-dependent methyltransferase [Planctomycetia bacterium]
MASTFTRRYKAARCWIRSLGKLHLLLDPPGHFYSPIPSPDDSRRADAIWDSPLPREIPGIDLRVAAQLELFGSLQAFFAEAPFRNQPQTGLRYYYHNPGYFQTDGLILYAMIRHLRPRRVIEIGSGFSSCVFLDASDRFFSGKIDCTFIDPFPRNLLRRISGADVRRVKIVPKKVQDVPLSTFADLATGDMLFIDSTHTCKAGSDVNYLLFHVLPSLAAGVVVHVHDVFYPFEYPRKWLRSHNPWNEIHALRAFLQFNQTYQIELLSTYLEYFYPDNFYRNWPLSVRDGGGSIWLRKLAA